MFASTPKSIGFFRAVSRVFTEYNQQDAKFQPATSLARLVAGSSIGLTNT